MKPDTSAIAIQETLKAQESPIELDYKFINRLVKEIDVERTKRLDKLLLNHAVIAFAERIRETDKRAWKILTDKGTSDENKLRAISEIRKNGTSQFNIMFDAGIFDRKLGEVNWNMQDVLKVARELEEKEKEHV